MKKIALYSTERMGSLTFPSNNNYRTADVYFINPKVEGVSADKKTLRDWQSNIISKNVNTQSIYNSILRSYYPLDFLKKTIIYTKAFCDIDQVGFVNISTNGLHVQNINFLTGLPQIMVRNNTSDNNQLDVSPVEAYAEFSGFVYPCGINCSVGFSSSASFYTYVEFIAEYIYD